MIPMTTLFLQLLLTRLERTWQSEGQEGIMGFWALVIMVTLTATVVGNPGDIAGMQIATCMTAIASPIPPAGVGAGVLIESK